MQIVHQKRLAAGLPWTVPATVLPWTVWESLQGTTPSGVTDAITPVLWSHNEIMYRAETAA